MLYCDRIVSYLEYRERGEKKKGAGFLKLEARGEQCELQICVRGLYRTDTLNAVVYLQGGGEERPAGTMHLTAGEGVFQVQGLPTNARQQTGLSYHMLRGVRIPLGEDREIYGWIRREGREGQPGSEGEKAAETPQPGNEGEKAAETPQPGSEDGESTQTEKQSSDNAGEKIEEGSQQHKADGEKMQESAQTEELPPDNAGERMEKAPQERETPLPPQMRFEETKWKQLQKVYEPICPFQDERAFLTIGPGDLLILSEKDYPLVHNSFLLHGYYSYHHLILAQIKKEHQKHYYVGVPGVYYEKEKQVAQMFGFDRFISRESAAGEGDFGYYMIRVEL